MIAQQLTDDATDLVCVPVLTTRAVWTYDPLALCDHFALVVAAADAMFDASDLSTAQGQKQFSMETVIS